MWKKKIQHRKVQFFLMGIMLVAIATVFATCLGFSTELKTYADTRFSEKHCPDVYIYCDGDASFEKNLSTKSIRANVKDAHAIRGKLVSVPMKYNNISISSITNMMCTLKDAEFSKYIQIVEGDVNIQDEPGDGEIWIAKTLASSYNIHVGDQLTINYEKPISLTVKAIYSATFAPSERLTIIANIVNNKTLEYFQSEEETGIIALNLYDTSEEKISELAMDNPYSLQTFDRAKLKGYITDISSVVGGIAAIAALVVFMAALFIIRFIIDNNLQREFKSIGIYKSLGYTSKDIIQIYIKAYVIVGGIAITVGSLIALPIVLALGVSTTKTVGGFALTMTSVIVQIGTIVLLTGLLWMSAMITLSKVKKITPVQAMSAGQTLGEQVLTYSIIKNASTPLETGINDIVKHKRRSIVTLLVLTISMYLILFFTSSYYTCANIYQNANVWITCPKFNAIMTGTIRDEIIQEVRESEYVQNAVCGNFFYYPPVNIPQYNGNARNVEFVVLDKLEEEVTKIPIREGYAPIQKEEIAVSKGLLEAMGMEIGDYLRIGVDGKGEKDYFITGSFTSMESKSIIMSIQGMQEIDPEYRPDNCFITLKDEKDFDMFKVDIESISNEIVINKEWTALKSAIVAIESMLTKIMGVMLIVFIVFAVISIVNLLALTINNKRKYYGILKSLGFSTKYIIAQNLWHIGVLLTISIVIASILHIACSRWLFSMIVIDAMTIPALLCILLVGGTVVLIVLVTILLSLPIRKITPVDLMEE